MHFRLAKRIRTFLSRILSENLEEWWKKKKQQEAEELEKSMKGLVEMLLFGTLIFVREFINRTVQVHTSQVVNPQALNSCTYS